MKKIVLIATYFGNLPFWFPAFQFSCKYNQNITWIIFTDSSKPAGCPDNLIFIKLSLFDFCEIASKKIGRGVNLSKKFLYKICDFKPAFGLIYEDYLQEYDFWGHCDLDIVWGKIDDFVNDEIIKNYDIITSRIKQISGHFCLYRNTNEINSLFLKIPLSIQLLQDSDRYQKIDEELFSRYLNLLINQNWFYRIKRSFFNEEVPRVYWNRALTTSGAAQRRLMQKKSLFKWQQGRVYDDLGEEMMYLHFHILKNLCSFSKCDIHTDGRDIIISSSGIAS
ncbi:MAG: DUF6625 family protein [Candidatus Electronema sp. VV]